MELIWGQTLKIRMSQFWYSIPQLLNSHWFELINLYSRLNLIWMYLFLYSRFTLVITLTKSKLTSINWNKQNFETRGLILRMVYPQASLCCLLCLNILNSQENAFNRGWHGKSRPRFLKHLKICFPNFNP